MSEWIKTLMPWRKNDPVYSCEVFKEKGCIHVDGYLCNMKTCPMLKVYRAEQPKEAKDE